MKISLLNSNLMKKKGIFLIILISIPSYYLAGQDTDIESLVNQGIAYHDKGEYDKAIETYLEALEIDPNSSYANYEIAYSYLASGDYQNAEKYSKTVIELNNDHQLPAYICYGNALDMQGKSSKAIKSYEIAIKEYDNYLLYYNHALTCFNIGKTEKAYESIIKAINDNPSHASSHIILSKIMESEGIRIKAMLPLYFFLLIEPNSERASIEYQTLRNYMDHGVNKTSSNNISVTVPFNNDPDFGAAEMMISLSKASNSLEENQGKSELQLFYENNDSLFKILGELKKNNTGFWWDFYVPFFYDLADENLTEVYSYYISLSLGVVPSKWIDDNNEEFERFKVWLAL
jgi:tetratricopeptide (TPR) repeat protein